MILFGWEDITGKHAPRKVFGSVVRFPVFPFAPNMKSFVLLLASALAVVQQAAGHAIFQDLWVNGVDKISTLAHLFAQKR